MTTTRTSQEADRLAAAIGQRLHRDGVPPIHQPMQPRLVAPRTAVASPQADGGDLLTGTTTLLRQGLSWLGHGLVRAVDATSPPPSPSEDDDPTPPPTGPPTYRRPTRRVVPVRDEPPRSDLA
ncbi:hypothetical protein KEM60_02317 [Austwickia sp. TVS 96-490-7B]|uniref:hypothetical protein n=1 Tax=Austwickia sp. TVS 96-490-7B TaxID=2830843 RepID=UPI001C572479|nr:hypothetical protein [Austwickia sp. TVS 96-490-7B]MBW3086106.1 hypothetical protein [Austwickia sp. TVS 96-490-7B]